MNIHEIADLITTRNFLAMSIDNLNVRLSREEIKSVQSKVAMFDKLIIEHSLAVDPTKSVAERAIISRQFVSSEPVEVVAERVTAEPVEPLVDAIEKPAKVRRSKHISETD